MRTNNKRFQWIGLVGIVLLTFIAHSSAIRGGFIFDDVIYVAQNRLLTSPHGLWEIWTTTKSPQYYPLVFTTFWVEQQLWGLNPLGYHVVNVSFHTINAVLVWWLLRRLNIPGAWTIAAVFAVHPVHVESVAWITERKNLLSGLFYLLALGCYLRFEEGRRWSWYGSALGLLILALLSKTVAATLPVVLLLVRWLKGWRIGWRDCLELIPFFVVGASMGLLTKWYEVHIVGAEGLDWNLSIGERLLVAGRALAFYVIKLFWPIDLTFNYPRWHVDIHDPIQWGWVVGVGMTGFVFWWKRTAWSRAPLVGLAFFSVSLAPALGFINVYLMQYSFVADHFQYLASIGIIALVVGSISWGFDQWIKSETRNRGRFLTWTKLVLGFSTLVILVTLTWKQGQIYRNRQTLWQDTLKKNPNSWLAHNNLGILYQEMGRRNESLQQFQIAISINPDYAEAHNNLAVAYKERGEYNESLQEFKTALSLKPNYADFHYNLANTDYDLGRISEAIQEYQIALSIKPDYAEAHNNLGSIYKEQGHPTEALQQFQTALSLKPDYAEAHNNLGSIYKEQGHPTEALQQYQIALSIKPDYAEAHNNLGSIYQEQENWNEAIHEYGAALSFNPNYSAPYYNLGNIYRNMGRLDKAIQNYQQAIKKDPQFALAHNNLGLGYYVQGRLTEAVTELKEAVRIKPDYAEAHNNLGTIYKSGGKFEEAILEYQTAIKLKPDSVGAYYNLGNTYKLMGRIPEATRAFKQALQINPNYEKAQQALNALRH